MAKLTDNPDVKMRGDGEQTRSLCYIDECVMRIHLLMRSDYHQPLNLVQDRMVMINELAETIADTTGIRIVKKHVLGPKCVGGRSSDNIRLRRVLGWESQISLEEGLACTYVLIEE